MKDTKLIGELSEAAAVYYLMRSGYSVSKPFGENQRYDLLADKNNKIVRVQCKTLKLKDGKLHTSLVRIVRRDNKFQKLKYNSNDIDAFVLYSPDTTKCYLVSINEAVGNEIVLRLTTPKNNQVVSVKWAVDYEI